VGDTRAHTHVGIDDVPSLGIEYRLLPTCTSRAFSARAHDLAVHFGKDSDSALGAPLVIDLPPRLADLAQADGGECGARWSHRCFFFKFAAERRHATISTLNQRPLSEYAESRL